MQGPEIDKQAHAMTHIVAVSWRDVVVLRSQVRTGGYEIDVEISVVVLFEFQWHQWHVLVFLCIVLFEHSHQLV